jgi:AbrB family looped-hinge helix DNA binding protein
MSEIVQIKPRWQITIPKGARDVLAIREGEYLAAEIKGRSLILKPMRPARVTGKGHSATNLKNLAGTLSIGGNAIDDTKKLYE